MKFKKIGARMLATILPVVIVALSAIVIIGMGVSNKIIMASNQKAMNSELRASGGEINKSLKAVSDMADTISAMVAVNYKNTELKEYEAVLGNIIKENDIVLGSGLWFEPNVYDAGKKYVGPYIYKDGDKLVTTYDYSNAEYDYFSQEYYTMCAEKKITQFTAPYYDETSGLIMSSCSAPIMVNGKYIGCVTVDIELSSIVSLVEGIEVGKTGWATLVSADGAYIAGTDEEKIKTVHYITEDENASLAKVGASIVATGEGNSVYKVKNKNVDAYYRTLDVTGWILILSMPQAELHAAMNSLSMLLVVISLVALAVAVLVILIQVRFISKSVVNVKNFVVSLAEGDFRIEPLKVKTKDEIGQMCSSLNIMYDSNKAIIGNIQDNVVDIAVAGCTLMEASNDLAEKIEKIQDFMGNVNGEMMNTSAATEEVNASTQEVLSNVHLLANEAEENMKMADEIRGRAAEIGKTSRAAYESATVLSKKFEDDLKKSMENAKVVESIGQLAEVISNIAEQINLLSLNASIEAARAGEAGRGFTVVASEIGVLAGNTSQAVDQIQSTITKVKSAFDSLVSNADELLGFLQNTVTPDYGKYVEVANQYEQDAASVDSSSNQMSGMAGAIKSIMKEITDAIQNIAEATQKTSALSADITNDVNQLSNNVTELANISASHENVVTQINDVVDKFVLR